MDPTISFEERARIGKEILSKQKPTTLEEAREQIRQLKADSKTKDIRKNEPNN